MEQTLYYNGHILTMETPQTAEAMLVGDGIIRGLGSLEAMRAKAEKSVTPVDLKGKTLLPAFLDPHSHFAAFSTSLSLAQLSACDSFESIAQTLRAFRDENHLEPGAWIFGFGYDHNILAERAHPDRGVLDRALPGHPVMLSNVSGHMGVLNSEALRQAGIGPDTPDPEGGRIGRDGAGLPTGYLEETAFINLSLPMPQPDAEQLARDFQKAQNIYLSHGIATAQEGLVRQSQFALIDSFAAQGALRLDLVGYVDLNGNEAIYLEHPDYHRYNRRFRLGGYKIFLDGSPQGKTAWLTRPYEGESSYRGEPVYTDEQLLALAETACAQKVQLLAHCN
ncbi:MAG: amidohydrolase family protein, partial [Oscillospiraceae bacterium]